MEQFEGLTASQRAAVEAVRGPVCILAGAGTGKTTTITRRIANQVRSGAFPAEAILAVTFTERAAREMRERLASLGVRRVRAKTFHAEALAQVARLGEPPVLVDSKFAVLSPIVRRLPAPFKFRATKDIASEIERAKNRRVAPDRYLDALGDHTPPIPPDVMARVYGEYQARLRTMGKIDFEDLLERAIALDHTYTRDRYEAFTVDEYQDVNLLQQTLLDAWLGGRDELCVVGDDHQSIFGFTGASAGYLLSFPQRYPGAAVVALEDNHRSTQQVLDLANRLGDRKLRSPRPGPQPSLTEHANGDDEADGVLSHVRRLRADGVAYEEMAVLVRVNASGEPFEEAFTAAGVPFQVRDGAFLRRTGPRSVLAALGRADPASPARETVEAAARKVGWDPSAEPDGHEETARQADLTRMVALAAAFAGPVSVFLEDLRTRFAPESSGRGVVISTYHRAKGLEFEAVFLPRMEERELPHALSREPDELDEERRLLYVGITRAKRTLCISWTRSRNGKAVRPSRFLAELMPAPARRERAAAAASNGDSDLFARLRSWRARVAGENGLPPYCVFHDATLREICELRPATLGELASVPGVGPAKLARYGSAVLELVGSG